MMPSQPGASAVVVNARVSNVVIRLTDSIAIWNDAYKLQLLSNTGKKHNLLDAISENYLIARSLLKNYTFSRRIFV